MSETRKVNAKINGIDVTVPEGTSILHAALKIQVRIPTLCFHPDLPPTASCGVCVVKLKGRPNLVRACSTPIEEGMDITTQDPEIVAVRRSVLSMILSNHPNECLTCIRNGSCELQSLAEDFGISRDTLPTIVSDQPVDDSMRTIVLDARKCVHCGRCIEVCQQKQNVWALCMKKRGLDSVVAPAGDIKLADSPCVRCGQCSAHCPVGAIHEYDQTEEVWKALMDPNSYCVAQIAPAVRVSIGEAFGLPPGTNLTEPLYAALRRMGFDAVFDTNFGADVTIMEEASEFIERFVHGKGELPLITSCCPAWVDFLEKFETDMIGCFSTCKSPQAIVGTLAKSYYAGKVGVDPNKMTVVSIMPCTAKKFEIRRAKDMFASGAPDINVSLTTRELSRMFKQLGIRLGDLRGEKADSPLGAYSGAGTIFGYTGGVMEAALRTAYHMATGQELADDRLEFAELHHMLAGVKTAKVDIAGKEVRVAVAHGLRNVETLIDRIRDAKAKGEETPFHFVEVMACPGGCVGGGGQFRGVTDRVRKERAAGLVADDRGRALRRSHNNPDVAKLYADFIGRPLSEKAHKLFHTSYKKRPLYKR